MSSRRLYVGEVESPPTYALQEVTQRLSPEVRVGSLVPIVKKVGNVSYKVQLLGWFNADPVVQCPITMIWQTTLVIFQSVTIQKLLWKLGFLSIYSPTEW